MKFYGLTDIKGFFQTIEKTEGDVYILTNEGDRINLKSNLSRFVAFIDLFSSGTIKEMELQAENPRDKALLLKFLMFR